MSRCGSVSLLQAQACEFAFWTKCRGGVLLFVSGVSGRASEDRGQEKQADPLDTPPRNLGI